MDWWPISLWVNNEVKPFDDKDVRWALSYYIDRKQLIDVGYAGACATIVAADAGVQAADALFRRR